LRKILIAILVVLFLGSAGLTSPVQASASTDTIYILPKLEANPQGSLILCPGEKLWIYVTYSETRYRVTSAVGSPAQGAPEPGVEIEGTVQNRAVGRLLNPTLETKTHLGLVVARFVFKAGDRGDTKITFEASGNNLAPLSPQNEVRLPTAPATVNVHVGCKFKVVAFSHWLLNWGFRYNAKAVVEAMLIPDRNGVIPNVSAPVNNPTNVTLVLCQNGVDVNNSNATITSQLDVGRGILHIIMDYGTVSATAWIRCPAPYVGFIGAESQGNGEPVTITTRPLSITLPTGGGGLSLPHLLESDNGPVNGTIAIVVVKLPN
jgi:hypothetical protein